MKNNGTYQECSRCLFSNLDYPEINFDGEGVCSICRTYDYLQKRTVLNSEKGKEELNALLKSIKSRQNDSQYDCIVGISGGVDSTYLAHLAKQWGLYPLVVHVDGGWNSELAINNIEKVLKKVGFDLHTYVLNWEEMRDMQLAFFKSSVIDIDLPFDNAYIAVLYLLAKKHKLKYILTGHNTVTEGWLPERFVHNKLDTLNLVAIHKKFGTMGLKNFPLIGPFQLWWYEHVLGIKMICPLNYIPYNKMQVKDFLLNELGWKDYGGKHHENFFTKFYQGYILPEKFKFDKRKSHLSTLICSGQITKEAAKEKISQPPYLLSQLAHDKEFFIKKLGTTQAEFDEIMKSPAKKHTDFSSYMNIHRTLSRFRNIVFKIFPFLR